MLVNIILVVDGIMINLLCQSIGLQSRRSRGRRIYVSGEAGEAGEE
jgi:hypothetical protein